MCVKFSVKLFLQGIGKFLYAIVFGLLSIIRWLWRLTVAGVKKYPKSAIVISLVAIFVVWLCMYVHYHSKVVIAEHQRDSTSYRLQQYEQMYDGNTDSLIIVRKTKNDTLTYK